MSAAENMPGVCPRCECPETELLFERETEHEIWSRKLRKRILLRITRRQRACMNRNCNAEFWTTERVEVPDG